MADKSSGSCDYDVSAHTHTLGFLVKTVTVVATIYRHATYSVEIVSESLECLVYLLRQLAGRRHDDTIDGVLGIASAIQLGEYGQQIGCRLSGSSLCYSQHITAFEYFRNTVFLNRSTLFEMHIIECIQYVVI